MLALSLSSCSEQSEQSLNDTPRTIMSFAVSQEPITRADRVENITQLSQFYLWAENEGSIYLEDVFTKSGTSAYSFKAESLTECLWPGKKTTLDFFAASNYEFIATPVKSNPLTNHTLNIILEGVIWSDLMFAHTQYTSIPEDGVVNLNFKHVLGELGILLKGDFKDNPDNSIYVQEINVKGDSNKDLHLDKLDEANSWTRTEYSQSYFYTPAGTTMGYFLSYENSLYDIYVELLNEEDAERSTYIFLIPGNYQIEVSYICQNPSGGFKNVTKTCDVEVVQGKSNLVKLTLPFELDS